MPLTLDTALLLTVDYSNPAGDWENRGEHSLARVFFVHASPRAAIALADVGCRAPLDLADSD